MSGSEDAVVTVRPVAMADAAAVVVLIQQLGYDRPLHEVVAWISSEPVAAGQQACFVACVEGEVVGWIETSVERRLQSAPVALIGGLVVQDGFRGQRIGRRLCAEVESWARELGLTSVRVTSRSTREEAHRFYLRDGYRQVKMSMVFEKELEVGSGGPLH